MQINAACFACLLAAAAAAQLVRTHDQRFRTKATAPQRQTYKRTVRHDGNDMMAMTYVRTVYVGLGR